MADFLVLRLQGPLMSFGGVTVDEQRPTRMLPTKSMLTGLLANALGWRAKEGEQLNMLQKRLVFGARLDRPGEILVDYQNAHVSTGEALWRTRAPGALVRTGGSFSNVQRWRHYLSDASVTTVLTLVPEDESPDLEVVSHALMRPARPLFLGRIGCPPGCLIHTGEMIGAPSVRSALVAVPVLDSSSLTQPILGEWPASGPLSEDEPGFSGVEERADLRDWVDDVHTGWRLVARGPVTVPNFQEAP